MAKTIHNPIFASIGGFFTSNDQFRHAIVCTTEGKIFEIFFHPQKGKGHAYLACFDAINSSDAFFTSDDQLDHVVVVTADGDLSEVFYSQAGTFFSTPPLANFRAVVAVSAFHTPDDGLRHVIVATADGNVTEVFYGPKIGSHISHPPLARFNNIVAISAFQTPDDGLRHVIVATADGNITEVFYGPKIGSHISRPPLANFGNIVDIAGFFTPDDSLRHVIVATADGNITEVFYGPKIGSHVSHPPLANLNNIVGIAGFFTPDDGLRHVIVATADGNVTEVFYGPMIGSHVSRPPLATFAVNPPLLEDVSPDISNLDPNATAVLGANNISTAGRSVSIAGNAGELFVFNEKAGIWKNSGGVDWTQLPGSPLTASLNPRSFLAVDPNASGHVVAATLNGAFETVDGGTTWNPILQTWTCKSATVRAVAFANNSALVLATDCGIATRTGVGKPFAFFLTNQQPVSAISVSETKVWARTAGSLFVSPDNGTTWNELLSNSVPFAAFDPSALAAFDNFVYVESAQPGLGNCGAGNVIGIFNVATGQLTTRPVLANGAQTCDGTGLGGRRFIKSFIRRDPGIPATIGPAGRLDLIFGAGQEVYQAAGIDNSGNITNWRLVLATTESGALTSTGANPAVHIHADIWDFLIDTSLGATKAWVAGDGGVYETTLGTPFVFPESSGWIRRFGGMHTHQAHMITVIPTNPVNCSRLAYPTGDNEGWYRNGNMLVAPAPKWEVTFQGGNLGDANWSIADSNSPRFILVVRNQQSAAFIDYNVKPDIKFLDFLNFWMKKDANGNPKVLAGHFYPGGPTALQFIPSPKGTGHFTTLDAVMMCDLPLIKYVKATDSNVPLLPNTPLAQNTNGNPVLLRNQSFDTTADINANNATGWAIEIPSFPSNSQGFYVTGSRAAPIYFSFTSNSLSRYDGNNWTTVANNVVGSAAFGPAFVNPFDSNVLYIITKGGIQVSVDGGNNFTPEPALTTLVLGTANNPMTSLAQIAFNYVNPREIVAGAKSGVFYRNSAGRWVDLTNLLPKPLSLITGVGIDSEALYVSFDSRSVVRITGYRNA